jgi:hypothetical protein
LRYIHDLLIGSRMCALGHQLKFQFALSMSALPPKSRHQVVLTEMSAKGQ